MQKTWAPCLAASWAKRSCFWIIDSLSPVQVAWSSAPRTLRGIVRIPPRSGARQAPPGETQIGLAVTAASVADGQIDPSSVAAAGGGPQPSRGPRPNQACTVGSAVHCAATQPTRSLVVVTRYQVPPGPAAERVTARSAPTATRSRTGEEIVGRARRLISAWLTTRT